ncbi:MAG: glycosyltransferase [Ruminococcaceae bacterium]|nr:glycosyltransferase [Oscillospiraceae bacterium]
MPEGKQKRKLILLANSFPYGNWEAYLESEVKYYDVFDEIHICSLQIRKNHKNRVRELPSDKFKVFPVFYAHKLLYLICSVYAFFDVNFYKEIYKLIKLRKFSLSALVRLFVYISRAHLEAGKIKKYIKKQGLNKDGSKGIIYSYRFEYQPYVGLLIKKLLPEYIMISRAHRYDLYEEANSSKYIPLRELLLKESEKVVLISEDGYDYLSKKYPNYEDKMTISRLGTVDHGVSSRSISEPLKIVTCSSVVPVKRLNLIVESLKLISDTEIEWTHYGDGILLEDIKSMAKQLPENIKCVFKGNVNNDVVLNEYLNNKPHLFLNVSSSEGVPVSIMEAMSFGIPCVATDVGGNREIVKDGKNGFLLNADFNVAKLAEIIKAFSVMDESDYQQLKDGARIEWDNSYNAEKNYPEFMELLKEYL